MPQSSPSTRWCPTPEQLMILEEMYRSGVRTPNAAQIQQITAHLSNYGRIEGKNVFYWFQNHKARERQKLRRRLSRHYQLLYSLPPPPPPPHHHYCLQQQQQHHHQDHVLPIILSSPILGAPTLHQEQYWKMETAGNGGGGGSGEELALSARGYDEAFGDHEWAAGAASSSSRMPLRTLELFPTTSTGGLRDV